MNLLMECLKKGVSPVHVVDYAKEYLRKNGFEELYYDGLFHPMQRGKYFVCPYPDVLFAFTTGKKRAYTQSIRMAFAHVDQPCFKVKAKADLRQMNSSQINVEVYGGMMDHTWFDRPLGLAGTVMVRGEDAFSPERKRYDSARPIAIIPGIAIHMKRNANDGWKIDRQKELMPVTGLDGAAWDQHEFLSFLAAELQIPKEDILHYDLGFYNFDEPLAVGMENELISSPRIDNLASVAALLESIVSGERDGGINMIGLFDHEEVGSVSKSGADSELLMMTLKQFLRGFGLTDDMVRASMAKSFFLSVDGAHGAHPNYGECADITTQAYLGQGVAIKESSTCKYASDETMISILKQLAKEENIKVQEIGDRNTIRGGSTLGSMLSAHLAARGCDIGVPMWAMHSARETMAAADYESLRGLVTAFFGH